VSSYSLLLSSYIISYFWQQWQLAYPAYTEYIASPSQFTGPCLLHLPRAAICSDTDLQALIIFIYLGNACSMALAHLLFKLKPKQPIWSAGYGSSKI
jgi:hypothetical protein